MSGVRSTRILPRPTIVPGLAARLDIASRRPFLRGSLHAVRIPSRLRPADAAPVIRIRPARDDDIAGVQQLADAIWHAHYPGIVSPAQIDYMLARGYAAEVLQGFVGRPDRGLELAIADDALAAFAAWYVLDGSSEAKLDKLYVAVSLQRQGLGGRLLAHVCDKARAAGATTLILNVNKRNAQAVRAYEKHGFAIRDSVVVDIGEGFVMDDFVMARQL